MKILKTTIQRTLRNFGYEIVTHDPNRVPENIDLLQEDSDTGIISRVAPYTMTSPASLSALCGAVRYVEDHSIDGAIVECGVWKGGSMMATAWELMRTSGPNRDLYLFDTFEGLPEPGEHDIARGGVPALEALKDNEDVDGKWCRSSLTEVRENLAQTQYPSERIHFVEGFVEDTIPKQAPEEIAILRLDTDFYESTKHELIHLFPKLATGGVIIFDDYGYWQGARKATDEYIRENNVPLLLNRVDHSVRIAVKCSTSNRDRQST